MNLVVCESYLSKEKGKQNKLDKKVVWKVVYDVGNAIKYVVSMTMVSSLYLQFVDELNGSLGCSRRYGRHGNNARATCKCRIHMTIETSS